MVTASGRGKVDHQLGVVHDTPVVDFDPLLTTDVEAFHLLSPEHEPMDLSDRLLPEVDSGITPQSIDMAWLCTLPFDMMFDESIDPLW